MHDFIYNLFNTYLYYLFIAIFFITLICWLILFSTRFASDKIAKKFKTAKWIKLMKTFGLYAIGSFVLVIGTSFLGNKLYSGTSYQKLAYFKAHEPYARYLIDGKNDSVANYSDSLTNKLYHHGIAVYHLTALNGDHLHASNTADANISLYEIRHTNQYILQFKQGNYDKANSDDAAVVYATKKNHKCDKETLNAGTKKGLGIDTESNSNLDTHSRNHSSGSSIKHSIKSNVHKETDSPVSLNGQFNAKPYVTNIIIKDDMYDKPSVDYVNVLEALKGLKKCNLKNFENIKITLVTKVDNAYGKDIGYVPVQWYNFKASDIKKMSPDNMDQSDLNTISIEHGIKPFAK